MYHDIDVRTYRNTEFDIDALFIERWSPRSMLPETLSREELMALFEAARWAPSSYNAQPWRFLYAERDTPEWETFLELLVDFNRGWARNAAALIVIVSRKTFERNQKPAPTHSFDAGAAWQNLALQAARMGLVAHGMQGFNYGQARVALEVPDEFEVEAMVAVGRPGTLEDLPHELREREKPSDRKPLDEIVMSGRFRQD